MPDWFEEFDSRDYLVRYYDKVDEENEQLLMYFAQVVEEEELRGVSLLDFGCGPSICPLISLATVCREIHCADYLDSNLEEIRLWVNSDSHAFDWSDFFRAGIKAEISKRQGGTVDVEREAQQRMGVVRERIRAFLHCDATRATPLGSGRREGYDVMVSLFCLEHAAAMLDDLPRIVRNAGSALKTNGLLVLGTLRNGVGIWVQDRLFTTVALTKDDVSAALARAGFTVHSYKFLPARRDRINEYEGFMMFRARRNEPGSPI